MSPHIVEWNLINRSLCLKQHSHTLLVPFLKLCLHTFASAGNNCNNCLCIFRGKRTYICVELTWLVSNGEGLCCLLTSFTKYGIVSGEEIKDTAGETTVVLWCFSLFWWTPHPSIGKFLTAVSWQSLLDTDFQVLTRLDYLGILLLPALLYF